MGFFGSNVVTCHLKINQKIRDAIMFDSRRRIDELEALAGVSWTSCQRILTEELHMKRVAAKFVPRLLSGGPESQSFWMCVVE